MNKQLNAEHLRDDFRAYWEKQDPGYRRNRLNELGALPERDEKEEIEHDLLAGMVAQDEDDAQDAAKEESEPDDRS